MRLATDRVRELAAARGLTLGGLLRRAGVSRTAYYSLGRRPSALPRSVHTLARALGVRPSQLLEEDTPPPDARVAALLREARQIKARHRKASFDNVWHTLSLLDLSPIERLNRSLVRGRATTVHR